MIADRLDNTSYSIDVDTLGTEDGATIGVKWGSYPNEESVLIECAISHSAHNSFSGAGLTRNQFEAPELIFPWPLVRLLTLLNARFDLSRSENSLLRTPYSVPNMQTEIPT